MRPVTVLNASDRLVFTPKCKSGISELRSSISTPVRGQGPAVIVTTAVAQQAICHHGWLACLGHCKQLAMLFSRSTFRALTLGGCKPYSQMAGSGSGMVLTFALAQLLRKVPGNARMNGGSGSRLGLVPPH